MALSRVGRGAAGIKRFYECEARLFGFVDQHLTGFAVAVVAKAAP
jgi:hypothetical protein